MDNEKEISDLLDKLPRRDYIIRIKYKYSHETKYRITNELYEYNGDYDIYECSDWNEGEEDVIILGYIAIQDIPESAFIMR